MAAPVQRPLMCLVTDRRRLVPHASSEPAAVGRLVELVGAAARAGIDLIQLRERDLEAGALYALTRRCVDAVTGTAAQVVVNDRLDVAVAAGAHGVHLRSGSISSASARKLGRVDLLIGRSVHAGMEAADSSDSDYLIMGTIFRSMSKPGQACAGLDELRLAVRGASAPVLAIGGVTVDRVADVARTGAAGIAAIGLFLPPAGIGLDAHLESVARHVRRAFDTREGVS